MALLLHRNGHSVRLWSYDPIDVENIRLRGENTRFLPGVPFPGDVEVSNSMGETLAGACAIVMASPSQTARHVARAMRPCLPGACPVVNVAKGIENVTMLRMSEVLEEELPPEFHPHIVTLSGPSHAEEVSREIPTVVVAASRRPEPSLFAQGILMSKTFRIYTSDDLVGVELAGALKNVIALATGVCDGLGFGDNTKGALLTRGLAEITRLGTALGAKASTFAGLAGMGDLITTCMSRHSRNRYVGEQIGKGRSLEAVLSEMVMVAEGVRTTQSTVDLAAKTGVDMPISSEVHSCLFSGKDARAAVYDLMMRPPKPETNG